MAVNGISKQDAESHISDAFGVWSDRNETNWELDISFITPGIGDES